MFANYRVLLNDYKSMVHERVENSSGLHFEKFHTILFRL